MVKIVGSSRRYGRPKRRLGPPFTVWRVSVSFGSTASVSEAESASAKAAVVLASKDGLAGALKVEVFGSVLIGESVAVTDKPKQSFRASLSLGEIDGMSSPGRAVAVGKVSFGGVDSFSGANKLVSKSAWFTGITAAELASLKATMRPAWSAGTSVKLSNVVTARLAASAIVTGRLNVSVSPTARRHGAAAVGVSAGDSAVTLGSGITRPGSVSLGATIGFAAIGKVTHKSAFLPGVSAAVSGALRATMRATDSLGAKPALASSPRSTLKNTGVIGATAKASAPGRAVGVGHVVIGTRETLTT